MNQKKEKRTVSAVQNVRLSMDFYSEEANEQTICTYIQQLLEECADNVKVSLVEDATSTTKGESPCLWSAENVYTMPHVQPVTVTVTLPVSLWQRSEN